MTLPNEPDPGSEYADALRGVLERAAQVDAAPGASIPARVPALTRPPVIATVFVLFVGVLIFNLRFRAGLRPPEPTPAQAHEAAQVSLLVASQVVEGFREEHGRLPGSLDEVGFEGGVLEYRVRPDGSYELSATVGDRSVRYDSHRGVEALLRGVGLSAPGGS